MAEDLDQVVDQLADVQLLRGHIQELGVHA
jgi:hypothetical protein